ncbi:CACNA1I [Symbiodinium microadriaticum]|nr:CACNA1I [Symbiodinium microadriaticum]
MAAAIAAAVAVRRRDAAENDSPKSEASLPAAAAAALKKSKSQAALDLPPYGSGFWRYQRQSAAAYTGLRVQLTVAALIAGNFLMNVIEKWIDPDGDTYPDLWVGADIFFNVSFAIELVWNMYSFWLWRFWKSAWNVFDVIVVTIGLMNLALPNLPGPLHDEGFSGCKKLCKVQHRRPATAIEAFRVFRLFKRVEPRRPESLHKIIKSLSRAVPGVANAFLILLLVMSIYAILGVEFFGTYANGGNYTNEFDEVVEIITARELQFGYENFGSFHLSLFTMFQVLTGESWSEVITRPMLHTTDVTQAPFWEAIEECREKEPFFCVSLFFVSFNLVNGVVLINVVIAVLLEKMVDDEKHDAPAEEGDQEASASLPFEEQNGFHMDGPGKDFSKVNKLPDKAAVAAEHTVSGRSPPTGGGDPRKAEAGEDTTGPTKEITHLSSIAAMEADFQCLKKDMSKIKLQMELLMKEAKGMSGFAGRRTLLHGQRASLLDLEECVERLHGRRVDLEALLQSERRRVQELETELSGCKEQVKELQRTLKESYVQQFEASQKREELESHFSKLLEELHRMKADKEGLEGQIPQLRKDLKEARALNADQESQLVEATGELSLAEEVIDVGCPAA